MGRRECTGHHATSGALPASGTYLWLSHFQGGQAMVRLVFRPYTQVRRTICTSLSLWASTRVSSGFTLIMHISPSFGSQQACSHSNPSQKTKVGRLCTREGSSQSASLRLTGLLTR
ncbi:unnamed protein product [Brassica rapa subsp. narinosa]